MKNFKQALCSSATAAHFQTRKYPLGNLMVGSSANNTNFRNIVTVQHHLNTKHLPILLDQQETFTEKKNQSNEKLVLNFKKNTKKNPHLLSSTRGLLLKNQLLKNYSTCTHVPKVATRLQTSEEDHHHHHHTIVTIMSSEHQHDEHCGHHLSVNDKSHDASPNSLSGDETEFTTTKKKVSGIAMKKKSSSTLNESSCSHQIDYSQLSAHNQNPNLSRPEPSDPNISCTIEGLLQKKPNGINSAIPYEEDLTEEELAAQQSYEKLLNNNKEFVSDKLGSDPDFFNRIKDVQKPDYMLIGCSDSRVPPDQMTKTQPGQIFIHRNVANLVVNTDVNAMSVLQYAVEVLQVKHVIVMGHTRCGGVMAALTNKHLGLIDHWLRNIKDVYRLHKAEVDAIEDKDKKIHRMIELNIIEQTLNLCKTSVVQNAWAKGRTLHVHGWLCDIETGLIKDLEIEEKRWKEIENIYKYDFDL